MAFSPVPASSRTTDVFGAATAVGWTGGADQSSGALSVLSEEFVWVGEGVHPNDAEATRAVDVLAAVPLAAAVGWTVRGQPWSTHGRRIRTAIVAPHEDWDIRVMRDVREVDSLSERILVRRRCLSGLSLPDNTVGSAPNTVAKALRAAGFHLLLMGTR